MLGNAAWVWHHKNPDALELVVILEKVAGGIGRRLLMEIPFYISTAACFDLPCRLINPIVINLIAEELA
jgi:hypothetical protein